MTIDKQKLKALAWRTEDHLTDKSATTYKAEVAVRWAEKGWPVDPLFDQAQVDVLLAEIGQLKAENQMLRDEDLKWQGLREQEGEIEKLNAENEALRKDAERYRWLRDKQTFIWLIQDWFPGAEFTDVGAEIDAAMAKEASHG